jgi:tellurite resistance protein
MAAFAGAAERVRAQRAPAAADNPFLKVERAMADRVEGTLDTWRDWRDAWTEAAFHAVYGSLAALGVSEATPEEEAAETADALADAPEVRAALARIAEGSYAEAVVRMMILLARARGGVRRSRLARSQAVLTGEAPFAELTAAARQALIREQTLVVEMAPEEALQTLPKLLPDKAERRRALTTVEDVAGPEDELGEPAQAMLARLRKVLGVAGR